MLRPGKPRNVKPNGFIAQQTIHHCIRLDQHMCGDLVKSIDKLAEFTHTHLLGQRCRAAYVGKQHGQGDFRTAGMFEHFAFFTKSGVVTGLVPAHQVHEKSAPAFEGRAADLAAWV